MVYTMRWLLEVILLIFILWWIHFISIFIHEMGHAIGYMLVTKDKDWHISVGSGKTIYKSKRFSFNYVVFCRGYFKPFWEKLNATKKIIITLACGPLATLSLLLVVVILKSNINFENQGILSLKATMFFIDYSVYLNLALSITAIIPLHWKLWPFNIGDENGYVSDGLRILRLIVKNSSLDE